MEGIDESFESLQRDRLLAYMKGDGSHFFLEFIKGVGVLRVEDDNGNTVGRMFLSSKRSIDLFEQRLTFLKKLIYNSNLSPSDDAVSDLFSEQELVDLLVRKV